MTGDASTGKTFVAKVIFQELVRHYNKQLASDPLKTKGIILAYTRKAAYNIGGFTAHSILHLPFKSSEAIALDSNTLDVLSKQSEQLRLVLIDETSLIGSRMLFNMDRRLRQILHMATMPFGNVDPIFYGDFYQAGPIHDSLIFEHPKLHGQKIPYTFWRDNVKCFQLHQVMRQKYYTFISILNRIRKNCQTELDIAWLNKQCYRQPPNDPSFPYLFFINKDVDEHNIKMLSLINTNPYILKAIDNTVDILDHNANNDEKQLLPETILLKKGILVELIGGNFSIQDGLINGSDGVFMHYTLGDPNIIWIDFRNSSIGKCQRQNMK